MQSTLEWFKALGDKSKPLFLAMAGANLTDSGRHAASNEFVGLNEIYSRLYKAIASLMAGNKSFNAEDLWQSLNELAKPSHLDVALEAAFFSAKSLIGTYKDWKR